MFHVILTVLCAVFVIGYILYSAGGHEEARTPAKTHVFSDVKHQDAA